MPRAPCRFISTRVTLAPNFRDRYRTAQLALFDCDGNTFGMANGGHGDAGIEKVIRAHEKKHGINGKLFTSSMGAFRRALGKTTIELPKGQAAHVLRHSFASHFVMNGGDILTLQKILGHSSVVMTMRYSHLADDHLEKTKILNPIIKIMDQ